MRRNENSLIITSIIILSVLAAVLIGVLVSVIFSGSKNKEFATEISDLSKVENENNLEDVSTEMGKSVEDAKINDFEILALKEEKEDEEKIEEAKKEEEKTETEEKNKNETETNAEVEKNEEENKEEIKEEEKEEQVQFEAPVKGKILREFAKDSLVYSNTLEEWITHTGVDVKADKTTVVKCAAKGIVHAIKNDPRYGLTVIVNHNSGYQTIYANLLTAEFVVEGEELEQGQTIGTVGNTASFEILDDYHLHFELSKNGEPLNPTTYMNFE